MSQKLSADYLDGYGPPVPQNDFILVEIKDKEEDRTKSGIIKSVTEVVKPYVIVVEVSKNLLKADPPLDIQKGDIIEIVDIRHLLQFEGPDGEHLSLIDKKNVGAYYRQKEGYVAPKKTVLKTTSLDAPTGPSLQIVGADEAGGLV